MDAILVAAHDGGISKMSIPGHGHFDIFSMYKSSEVYGRSTCTVQVQEFRSLPSLYSIIGRIGLQTAILSS